MITNSTKSGTFKQPSKNRKHKEKKNKKISKKNKKKNKKKSLKRKHQEVEGSTEEKLAKIQKTDNTQTANNVASEQVKYKNQVLTKYAKANERKRKGMAEKTQRNAKLPEGQKECTKSVKCTNKAPPGKKRCDPCRKKATILSAKRKAAIKNGTHVARKPATMLWGTKKTLEKKEENALLPEGHKKCSRRECTNKPPPGRKQCDDCNKKAHDYSATRKDKTKETNRRSRKKIKEKKKEENAKLPDADQICTYNSCKKKSADGKKRCNDCNTKNRIRLSNKAEEKKEDNAKLPEGEKLCSRPYCKNNAVGGKKTCVSCFIKSNGCYKYWLPEEKLRQFYTGENTEEVIDYATPERKFTELITEENIDFTLNCLVFIPSFLFQLLENTPPELRWGYLIKKFYTILCLLQVEGPIQYFTSLVTALIHENYQEEDPSIRYTNDLINIYKEVQKKIFIYFKSIQETKQELITKVINQFHTSISDTHDLITYKNGTEIGLTYQLLMYVGSNDLTNIQEEGRDIIDICSFFKRAGKGLVGNLEGWCFFELVVFVTNALLVSHASLNAEVLTVNKLFKLPEGELTDVELMKMNDKVNIVELQEHLDVSDVTKCKVPSVLLCSPNQEAVDLVMVFPLRKVLILEQVKSGGASVVKVHSKIGDYIQRLDLKGWNCIQVLTKSSVSKEVVKGNEITTNVDIRTNNTQGFSIVKFGNDSSSRVLNMLNRIYKK